ncbi:hypothetical protein L1281_000068 [Neisseria sp. HSC-16F19]|nr:T6SS immunity protein Tli4 family protein [Neisseria sp. HSC-16F19]MCP2039503.1 hypothetical protein [Neisseria sp. HSC-16F19]
MKKTRLGKAVSPLLICAGWLAAFAPVHAQSPAYPPQTLYFHYFQMDVPADIHLDESVVRANFAGNDFKAYPIASQQAFTRLVRERINVFKNHKISAESLAYDRKMRAKLPFYDESTRERVKRDHPELNMTTALYEAIKVDEQRYYIVANHLGHLDETYNVSLYGQWYMYIPEQQKYAVSGQARIPASYIVTRDGNVAARDFFNKNIRALNAETLADPKVMAVGPIAWINATFHPDLHYVLQSPALPLKITVEAGGYNSDAYSDQNDMLRQITHLSGHGRSLARGTRTVADIRGQERCYDAPASSLTNPLVWCSWTTKGKKEDINAPSIHIHMRYQTDGSPQAAQQAMRVWEQLMKSVQRRGKG